MSDLTEQYLTAEPLDPEEVEYQRALTAARGQAKADQVKDFLGPMGPKPFLKILDMMQDMQDVPSNVVSGIMDAAINVYDTVGELIDEAVPGVKAAPTLSQLITKEPPVSGPTPVRDAMVAVRDASKRSLVADTPVDEFTRQTVQFIVPFSMTMKALGGVKAGATVANIAKGATAEAATVFGAFDPHGGRFADLVRTVSPDGLASNRFIDYLTNRENEGEWEGRFKNVIDSLSGSAAVGTAIKTGGIALRAAHLAATSSPPTKLQAQRGSLDLTALKPEQAKLAQESRNLWSSGKPPELVPQLIGAETRPLADYFERNPEVKSFVEQNPGIVSTRLPKGQTSTEDPSSGNLLIDYSVIKSDPKTFNKNIGLMADYANFKIDSDAPEQQAEQMIETMKSNLLFLHDVMPEQYRDRSHLWYVGARNIVDDWAPKYDLPDRAVSGVLAVLSPQKDWFQNVSLGQRVLDITRDQRNTAWNRQMDEKAQEIWDAKYAPVISLVRGKKLSDLQTPEEKALWLRTYDQAFNSPEHSIVSPEGRFEGTRLTETGAKRRIAWGSLNEIGKAIAIIDNPDVANISQLLGEKHKVRSFYSNIYAPFDPRGAATIDTHAVAAALLRPLSGKSREVLHNFGSGIPGEGGPGANSVLGINGTYGIILEAYRRAAAERGLLPRELQSITWEGVRGLFPDKWKRPQNEAAITSIWNRYRNGQITLQEAQNEVIQASPNKGTGAPEWARAGK